ncbi:hypothetical protein D3C79_853720 [compost metagenome]
MQERLQAQATAQLLSNQHHVNAVAAKAAIGRVERHRGQAQFAQLLPERIAEAARALPVFFALFKAIGVAHQACSGVLQHVLLLGQFEVHGLPLRVRESSWR